MNARLEARLDRIVDLLRAGRTACVGRVEAAHVGHVMALMDEANLPRDRRPAGEQRRHDGPHVTRLPAAVIGEEGLEAIIERIPDTGPRQRSPLLANRDPGLFADRLRTWQERETDGTQVLKAAATPPLLACVGCDRLLRWPSPSDQAVRSM